MKITLYFVRFVINYFHLFSSAIRHNSDFIFSFSQMCKGRRYSRVTPEAQHFVVGYTHDEEDAV